MAFEDYNKFFVATCINAYEDNAELVSVEATQQDGGFVFYACDIDTGTHNFSVSQKDKRMFGSGQQNTYTYATSHITVVKFKGSKPSDGFEFVGGNADGPLGSMGRDVTVTAELQAGRYGVFVEMEWNNECLQFNRGREFAVTRYGPDGNDCFEDLTNECSQADLLKYIIVAYSEGTRPTKTWSQAPGIKFWTSLGEQTRAPMGYDFVCVVNNDTQNDCKIMRQLQGG